MALRVYSDGKYNNVYLSLSETDGEITLQAVDKITGEPLAAGCILTIKKNGKIFLYPSCQIPGIATDSQGRVMIDD